MVPKPPQCSPLPHCTGVVYGLYITSKITYQDRAVSVLIIVFLALSPSHITCPENVLGRVLQRGPPAEELRPAANSHEISYLGS